MKINKLLLICLFTILVSCGSSPTTVTPTTTTLTPTTIPTTATSVNAVITGLKVENLSIVEGNEFKTHVLKVLGVYSNGTEKELDSNDYDVVFPSDLIARLGIKSEVTIILKSDENIKTTVSYDVSARLEGELGKTVNSTIKTEPEYTLNGDNYVVGKNVSFAGGFGKAVNSGSEGSVTLSFVSVTNTTGGFTIRMSNSNLQITNDGYYYMRDLKMNTIIDLTINNTPVAINDNIVIPGTPVYTLEKDYVPCYGIYHNINFENIAFRAGINDIKISFKPSTISEINYWEESPSEGNIDYVDVHTSGEEVSGEISSIRVDERFAPKYADLIEDTIVIATTSDNKELVLNKTQVNIVDSEDSGNIYYVYKRNNVKVTLIGNEEVSCLFTFEIAKEYITKLKWEDIEIDTTNNKVYWTFEFNNRGYTADQYRLFDGSTTFVPCTN